jgi:hypothetical protein
MDSTVAVLVASAPMQRAHRRIFGSKSAAALVLAVTLIACSQQPVPTTPEPATPDAAPAADAAGPDLVRHTGGSVFVAHEVEDFAAFQKYFEGGAADRTAAGIEGHLLTRLDNGKVVIHFFAPDVAKVQAELNSEAFQKYLSRKGAPDASLVWVTHDEVVYLPAKPVAGPTFSLYLKRRTTDFARFRQEFEKHVPVFSKQLIGFGLHQSATQPDMAILHFVATTKAAVEALPNQPELKELMALTTEDAVKPLIGEDVSRGRVGH